MWLPTAAEPILTAFSIAFTEPTFQRVLVLSAGAILAKGPRTILAILWAMGDLAEGDCSDYHRVFSRAPWSMWTLGKVLGALIIELVPFDEWVAVAIDETVDQHKGKKVYGKGCHHDAVRSSDNHTVYKWGHKWVVLAIVVKFPFTRRPWALPVLKALYRPKELNEAEGRRHKTPAQLARGLMAALMHWFPNRKFVFLGDGGFASHELTRFARRHRKRCALISRFHHDARLFEPPPEYNGSGRPCTKGKKLPTPGDVVSQTRLRKTDVEWYGATMRQVQVTSGVGEWYKSGRGLASVEWVFVRDATGTRRDEYFFCTLPGVFSVEQIVRFYTLRWNIEVTFQELRAHLGLETTRQRVQPSVMRMAPCLMGLYSVVALIYHEHLKGHKLQLAVRPGYEKTEPTFSDALTTVRELFWTETIFQQPYYCRVFQNIPPKMRDMLLSHLAQAI